ncbi:MFS transporter [Legionella bozemanae]|uniref:MFS transporter n=1 Tax=Legionella bozemanae TaxID=447 RepID=UPI0010413EBD|nr:MFS transporter [Legionella bozemanae]
MKISISYSGVIWCLLAGVLCVNASHFISIPFLTLYLTNKAHYSLWLSGLVVGLAPFFSILGGFIGGQLSDKYGRILLLYFSVFSTALIFIFFYFAFQIKNNTIQLAFILVLNALFGLSTSFFQPSVMALMTDLVDKMHREQVFHLRYAAMNIGAMIGPLIGVYFGIILSSRTFFIGGIIYFIYGCLLYYVLKNNRMRYVTQHNKCISFFDSIHVVFADKRLLNFILFHLIFAICYSQITSTLAYYIAQKNVNNSTQVYSFVITLNALFVLLGQAPIYFLCKKMARNKVIFYGCILFFLGCLGFAYSRGEVVHFYISILVITIGELLIFPFASGFIDDIAPSHLKGTYFGALTFRELGLAFGPILGGVIFQTFGGKILFLCIGVLALCSFYFVLLCERSKYEPINSTISLDEGV